MKLPTIHFDPIRTTVGTVVAIGLIITSGLWAGNLTRRWGQSREFEVATQMLKSFPRQIGQWQMDGEPTPLSEKALGILQCEDAHMKADYVHAETKARVTMILMAGPYGPLSVHKPDVCYPNAGLAATNKPQRHTFLAGQPAEGTLWLAEFRSGDASELPFQVGYGWSRGQQWQAADNPRFAFGGAPVLFKLQVDTRFDADPNRTEHNPCNEFLEDFLVVWQRDLAPQLSGNDST